MEQGRLLRDSMQRKRHDEGRLRWPVIFYVHSYIQYLLVSLPESDGIGADGLAAAGGPDGLVADLGASVSRVDHLAVTDNNADVNYIVPAVTVLAPEDHVARLSLGAGDVLAHGRVVLSLSSAG